MRIWVDVWSTLSYVLQLQTWQKAAKFLAFVSLYTFNWSIIKSNRRNGSQNATDNLVPCKQQIDVDPSRSDILYENARRLAVPILLKSYTFILKFVLFVWKSHLYRIYSFSAEKSILSASLVHSNDNYKLHFGHSIKGQENKQKESWLEEDKTQREKKTCCENTNYTIMDIDLLQKENRIESIENAAENWHCSRNECTTNKLSNTQKNQKKDLYLFDNWSNKMLSVCSLSLCYICCKPFCVPCKDKIRSEAPLPPLSRPTSKTIDRYCDAVFIAKSKVNHLNNRIWKRNYKHIK